MTLTIGSLFAGIGGIELGLEWTGGFRTVWQVERDEYCRGVLAKHWPDAIRHTDVCTVGRHNLTPVDLICGGFPCQDISGAGRQAGIAVGTRSGLWHEYVRIIRELRPKYVFVENVAALLVRGLDVVLGQLAEIGYDAEWDCLPASAFGAPHIRDRVFVVAYPRQVRLHAGGAEQSLSRSGMDGSQRNVAAPQAFGRREVQRRPSWNGRHATVGSRTDGRLANCEHWQIEPSVGRVADGIPRRVDRIGALGNAVVPQCAEFVGLRILELEAQRQEAHRVA